MLRKLFFSLLALLALALIIAAMVGPGMVEQSMNVVTPHEPYQIDPRAQALHDDLLIGDWHTDSLLWKRNLLQRADRGHVDIPRLQAGNVGLQMFTAVTKSPRGQNYESNSADAPDNITPLAIAQLWPPRTWSSLYERAVYQAEKLHNFAAAAPDDLMVIEDQADLQQWLDRRQAGDNIVGGLLGIEGAHPLQGDLANLPRLANLGYRMIGLQHFFDNELGGSLHGTDDAGLTDFGRDVVRYVQDHNLILDLAHSSPQVAREALAMTSMPVVVSHTGIYGHCNTKRNFRDDLMQQIAATGGVIAIGFWEDVTCDATPDGVAAAIKAAIALLGEDHVALGSDYDGSVTVTFDTSEMAALTQALLKAGLSEPVLRKVMGENMIRVLADRLPE